MLIREHEIPPGTTRCKHCGGLKTAFEIKATCIQREVEDVARDSERRVLACEDQGAISARLAELRAERDALLSAPPEAEPKPPGLSGTDFDIGDFA